uniref:Uncharacterized protein n=1 Tax=viral metagenome TaxID=1070528 RepID=A0A6M3LG22_9ZZZZ
MKTTTVRQHTRRVSPPSGVRRPREMVNPAMPFFVEPEKLVAKTRKPLLCHLGLHSVYLTGKTHYLSMSGISRVEYKCKHCSHTEWRDL